MGRLTKLLNSPYYTVGNYLFKHCPNVMPDEWFLKVQWKQWFGYELDIKHPRTLNEKLQWLKLDDRNPLYSKLADKYEMKQILPTIYDGEVSTVPTIAVYDKVKEIEWDRLPESFVIKCTHDSGSSVFCINKALFDIDGATQKLERCMKENYYLRNREWVYKNIEPRIIVEPLLKNKDGSSLVDYKFYIYGGELQYWMCSVNESTHAGTNLKFSPEKKNIDYLFKREPKLNESEAVFPNNLDEMINLARIIGKSFRHVRIDMYNVDDVVLIGEFTFYSSGGYISICNQECAKKLADLIDTSK